MKIFGKALACAWARGAWGARRLRGRETAAAWHLVWATQPSSSPLSLPSPPESLGPFGLRVLVVSLLPSAVLRSTRPPSSLCHWQPKQASGGWITPTPPTSPRARTTEDVKLGVPLFPQCKEDAQAMDLPYEKSVAGNFTWIVFRPIFFCYEKQAAYTTEIRNNPYNMPKTKYWNKLC